MVIRMNTHACRSVLLRTLAAVLALSVAGCSSTPKVRVDKDTAADFSKCQSFGWRSETAQAPASLVDQRMRAAAFDSLQAKGYRVAEQNADCWIDFQLTTRETQKFASTVGVGVGGGSGHVGGGIGISVPLGRKYQYVGTLRLDVIDASRRAQIWSGSLAIQFRAPEPST